MWSGVTLSSSKIRKIQRRRICKIFREKITSKHKVERRDGRVEEVDGDRTGTGCGRLPLVDALFNAHPNLKEVWEYVVTDDCTVKKNKKKNPKQFSYAKET